MHKGYWLSLLASLIMVLGCNDESGSSNNDQCDPSDKNCSNNTDECTGDNCPKLPEDCIGDDCSQKPNECTGDNCQDPTDTCADNACLQPIDECSQNDCPPPSTELCDDTAFKSAKKLSDNILEIYYKSASDEDYGENIKFLDMSTLAKDKSTEYTKTGSATAKITYSGNSNWRYVFYNNAEAKDLSPYKTIAFWMYVPEESVGGSFFLYLSDKGVSSGYRHVVKLNNAGWNYVALELEKFAKDGNPAGWNSIISFFLYEDWTNKTKHPFTVYIDDVYLYEDLRDANQTESVIPSTLDGALFSLNGSRSIIENQLIKTSFKDDNSIVYQADASDKSLNGSLIYSDKTCSDGKMWLPLAAIASRYDKDAVYDDKSHILKMKLNDKTYIFEAGTNKVLIDCVSHDLDFVVGLNGDSLFVPMNYIKQLMDYKNVYCDNMGMVYFYNNENNLKNYTFNQKLTVAYETLFSRPSGEAIMNAVKKKNHPRVMLTKSDFDRVREFYQKGNKDDYLHKDFDGYFNPLWGVNSKKFKQLGSGDETIATLIWGGMYNLTSDDKFVARIWDVIKADCEKSSWGDSGPTIGPVLFRVSVAYDWLYDKWSAEQRKTMEQAVLKNGFTDKMIQYYESGKTFGNDNHNGISNGSFMTGAIAFADVPDIAEKAQKFMGYSIRNVEAGMFQYAPDGGYIDGTHYWQVGTSRLYYMISSVDAAAGTNYGLFYSPGFARSAYFSSYMESPAGTWFYHDPSSSASFVDTEPLPWFAKKLNDPDIGYLRRKTIAKENYYHTPGPDLLWYDPALISENASLPLDAHFDYLGTMVMHSSWKDDDMMVGIHGGKNTNGGDHYDWDIGNFIIFSGIQQFINELGAERYSGSNQIDNYFGENRKKLYRKRAEGQNTLVIGEVTQNEPDQITSAVSELLRKDSNNKSAIGIVDMAPAYKQVSEGKRGLFFKSNRSVAVIQDEIQLSSKEIVRWSAHTSHTINIINDGKGAVLCNPQYWDGQSCVTCNPDAWNASKKVCKDTSTEGLKCLYAEIISEDSSLKFVKMDAKSFAADYKTVPNELARNCISKLAIITNNPVNNFKLAVAFKVIDPDETVAPGSLYQWTDMKDWKLE